MNAQTLPEGIITRFRTLSLERIARVESAWNAVVQGAEDEESLRAVARELHTLKGDARIVGFEEVHLLSHKLEELFALAAQLNYAVSDDFDLVVTMATQFVTMMLRAKSGGASGIDLDGFMRQVDDVLRETHVLRKSKPTNPRMAGPKAADLAPSRLAEPTRRRLAAAATDAYIEYLSARNQTSRARLRGVWQALSEELAQLQTVDLRALLERHVASGPQLARELGKEIELVLDIDDVRLDSRVAEAVDVAVVHLIRNAIDHGIETPDVRAASGKPLHGRIRLRARDSGGQIELALEDDGAGIDLQAVRTKAIEQGLLPTDRVVAERELYDVLFQPGFSTREAVTDVSGRGVGLDAVKAGVVKVGGSVRVSSRFGAGTTITLVTPAPIRQLRVFQFLAPGNAVSFAISARWTPTVEAEATAEAIDPLAAIQLMSGSRQTLAGIANPPRDLVLRLRWGFLEIALRTSTEPRLVTAERICPTTDDQPVEVVQIDGVEALLLRPEHVSGMIRRGTADA